MTHGSAMEMPTPATMKGATKFSVVGVDRGKMDDPHEPEALHQESRHDQNPRAEPVGQGPHDRGDDERGRRP